MSKTLDFYFDFGSPTAYLAHCRLQQLAGKYDLEVNYLPLLLGGVFKATGNVSPVTIPAKGRYMNEHDLPRFARRYGVTLNFNPHFPINTLQAMREVIAEAGLDADSLLAATADSDVKAELIRVTEEAVARGTFGAPTLFLGDDMFFGQDRLDFIEEALAGDD